MNQVHQNNSELVADRRADRRTLILVAVMATTSLLVQANTRVADVVRSGAPISASEIWVNEITSHVVLVGLAFLIPHLLDRVTPSLASWCRSVPLYLVAFVLFSALHIGVFTLARMALYPAFVGAPYLVDTLSPGNLAYEGSKDFYVYLVLLFAFISNRLIEQARREGDESLRAARTDHKLTLKSGGAVVFVNAADVIWAKAAGNYVEVHTRVATHFCRMTLSQLEDMLASSGPAHMRVHKSYLVNLSAVAAVKPTGEGDAEITLSSGDTVPVSRRHRERIAVLSAKAAQ